jgi:hypothetical protein
VYDAGGSRSPEGGQSDGRVFDLGVPLDALLGHAAADSYILLVIDPSAGGLQAYGPYSEAEADTAAATMRGQFRDESIEGVSVHVLPLYAPGD